MIIKEKSQVVCEKGRFLLHDNLRKKGSGLTIHCVGRFNSGKAKKASKNAVFQFFLYLPISFIFFTEGMVRNYD